MLVFIFNLGLDIFESLFLNDSVNQLNLNEITFHASIGDLEVFKVTWKY